MTDAEQTRKAPPRRKTGPQEIEGTEGGEPVSVEPAQDAQPTEVEGTPGGKPVMVTLDENQGPQRMEGTPGGEPVIVKFEDGQPGKREPHAPGTMVTRGEGQTLAPTTTEEEDRVVAGQRQTSMLWEAVRAIISVAVCITTLFVLARLALNSEGATINQLHMVGHLMVMTTMILTFYYQRINTYKIGGVGPKATDDEIYRGR